MPNAVSLQQEGPYPAPRRLAGALAAGTVVVKNTSIFQRLRVAGLGVLRVRVKPSAIVGTLTLQIYPVLSDGGDVDTTGTRAATNLPTAATVTTAAEMTQDYTLAGEQYVDVVLSLSNGGSDTATLSYVDVFAIP